MKGSLKLIVLMFAIPVATFLTILAVMVGSNSANPGDLLYGLDRGIENVRLDIAQNAGPGEYIRENTSQAYERLAEIKVVSEYTGWQAFSVIPKVYAEGIEQPDPQIEGLADDYQMNILAIIDTIAQSRQVNELLKISPQVRQLIDTDINGLTSTLDLLDTELSRVDRVIFTDLIDDTEELDDLVTEISLEEDSLSENVPLEVLGEINELRAEVSEANIEVAVLSGDARQQALSAIGNAMSHLNLAIAAYDIADYKNALIHTELGEDFVDEAELIIDFNMGDDEDFDESNFVSGSPEAVELMRLIALDKISSAQNKIDQAEEARLENSVSSTLVDQLIVSAESNLGLARVAFDDGDYENAVRNAKNAKEIAKQARDIAKDFDNEIESIFDEAKNALDDARDVVEDISKLDVDSTAEVTSLLSQAETAFDAGNYSLSLSTSNRVVVLSSQILLENGESSFDFSEFDGVDDEDDDSDDSEFDDDDSDDSDEYEEEDDEEEELDEVEDDEPESDSSGSGSGEEEDDEEEEDEDVLGISDSSFASAADESETWKMVYRFFAGLFFSRY